LVSFLASRARLVLTGLPASGNWSNPLGGASRPSQSGIGDFLSWLFDGALTVINPPLGVANKALDVTTGRSAGSVRSISSLTLSMGVVRAVGSAEPPTTRRRG